MIQYNRDVDKRKTIIILYFLAYTTDKYLTVKRLRRNIMNYGKKIAELRKTKGLTQQDLGSRLNVTAQAVSKWENDLSEPDLSSIKKMCDLFEVSVNDFLNVSQDEQDSSSAIKIINGYCEKCKKPVGPNEYEVSHWAYDDVNAKKVVKTAMQHVYCTECAIKINEAIQNEEKERKLQEEKQKEADAQIKRKKRISKFIRGLIIGGIVALILGAISVAAYCSDPSSTSLVGLIVLTVGAFTLTAQLFWDCFINDFFLFFCRSFKAPFGFIIELDLDGILWFITVKLALWIICGILSILFFLLGLLLSLLLSIITFPFTIPYVLTHED